MKTKFDFKKDVKCEAFSFYHGLFHYYAYEVHSPFGYSIELNNVDSKTYIQFEDFDEAVETCMNHYNRFDKVKEEAEERIKYLSSPEGAWGRSGT